jgi:hypothetical protein
MLDVNACRSTHLIGDSADVAASTICKDYESRDDEAKRATFQTSTPATLHAACRSSLPIRWANERPFLSRLKRPGGAAALR